MENAVEALTIAFGTLLTVLILSLLVYMIGNVSIVNTAQEDKEEIRRLAMWNEEWEAYNKKLLYGSEILTVVNKAEQNNIDHRGNSQYEINVIVLKSGVQLKKEDINKNSIFECQEIKRNAITDRINEIIFNFLE